jgi:hypothetical protein
LVGNHLSASELPPGCRLRIVQAHPIRGLEIWEGTMDRRLPVYARASLLTLAVLLTGGVARATVSVQFNYDYATGTFVDDPAARALLDLAALQYTPLLDTLAEIDPASVPAPNSWSARIRQPTTGVDNFAIADLFVPADTLIIYVGARDLGGSVLGEAAPGGRSITYTSNPVGNAWRDLVDARGEIGEFDSPATDFGPWGGWISFDSDANWNLAAGLPAAGQADFLSVAIHELGHVFGYGSADSWFDQIDSGNGTFLGGASQGVYGAPVPLADSGHWSNALNPEPALDPSLTTGTRKLLTSLDYAGLLDIGWDVPLYLVPEPDTGVLVTMGLVLLIGVASTRRSAPPRRAERPPPPRDDAARRHGRRRSRGWTPARG